MKTYTSREQIIKDIDSALRRVGTAKAIAQEHLDNEMFLVGIDEKVAELRDQREKADFQFRKIKRLEIKRLPYLKARLAEFDTLLLLEVSPDTSPVSSSAPAQQSQTEPCDASNDVMP